MKFDLNRFQKDHPHPPLLFPAGSEAGSTTRGSIGEGGKFLSQDSGGVNLAITIERRKHPRGDIRWPISLVADHGTITGETRNISVDGISIRCDEPLRINEVFRIAILPPNRQAIGVSGRVIWSDLYAIDHDDTAVGLGLCFVEISDEDRKTFNDAVSAFISDKDRIESNDRKAAAQ